MKTFILALWMVLAAVPVRAQLDTGADHSDALRESEERERIRQTRASQQAQFTAQDARCYARFAVNDCLAEVRSNRREVLGDLRRQEISLNDAQRKRRGAEQLLRSDERSIRTP